MTNEELSKWLAEEIMDCVVMKGATQASRNDIVWSKPGMHNESWMTPACWTPPTDMNQAMMCIEKYFQDNPGKYLAIEFSENKWCVNILYFAMGMGSGYADNVNELPLALCTAIKQAKEAE